MRLKQLLLNGDYRRMFSIDVRSLVAFRIALGAIICLDLLLRMRDLVAHYTDYGVLTRQVVLSAEPYFYIPLFFISGEVWPIAALFCLAIALSVALIIGYRTTLSGVLLWLLLISLHARNPLILYRGDMLLRMLLFWSLFLPLGQYASVDTLRNGYRTVREYIGVYRRQFGALYHNTSPPILVHSIAGIAIMAQVALMYLFSVFYKSGVEWWSEQSALYYALSIDQLTTPIGRYLLAMREILPWLTSSVMLFEFFGLFLLFSPIWLVRLRSIGILGFFGLHAGFFVCMYLGLFPLISMLAMIPFIPGEWWDRGRAWISRDQRIRPDRQAVSALSDDGLAAPSMISATLNGTIVSLTILFVTCWNLQMYLQWRLLPQWTDTFAETLQLKQTWSMFAPRPGRLDGWYIIKTTTETGEIIDLWNNGAPLTYERPSSIAASIRNLRWQKYLKNGISIDYWHYPLSPDVSDFARYICFTWNTAHPLKELEIIFMKEWTLPDYQTPNIVPITLWKGTCTFQNLY